MKAPKVCNNNGNCKISCTCKKYECDKKGSKKACFTSLEKGKHYSFRGLVLDSSTNMFG